MPREPFSLVADIGGTNARFALVSGDSRALIEPRSLRCADFPTLVDATRAYLNEVGPIRPQRASMSIASPVTGDMLDMTNHDWSLSVSETREALGLHYLKMLNDYTALALALPTLGDDQRIQVGGGEGLEGHPQAVLGPGTGLGVSGIVPAGTHWVPLESEGGHVSYGPLNEREQAIVEILREGRTHVSAESLVSGPGLELIHAAIVRLEDGEDRGLSAEQVTRRALGADCPQAVETLGVFCNILGTVAGNLALTLGARGGVYIGGGIVPRILDFFLRSGFRERFEQHGRMTSYLRAIPTYVIDADYPALIGAMLALDDACADVGVSSRESPAD